MTNLLSIEDVIKKVNNFGSELYLKGGKAGQTSSIICDQIIEQLKQNILSPQQASDRVDKSKLNRYLNSRGRFS